VEIASSAALVWEGFMGAQQPALLFRSTINVEAYSEQREERLSTGMYTLVDVRCRRCCQPLGWQYVRASAIDQKYKEGGALLQVRPWGCRGAANRRPRRLSLPARLLACSPGRLQPVAQPPHPPAPPLPNLQMAGLRRVNPEGLPEPAPAAPAFSLHLPQSERLVSGAAHQHYQYLQRQQPGEMQPGGMLGGLAALHPIPIMARRPGVYTPATGTTFCPPII
jgi:hypothetical protein